MEWIKLAMDWVLHLDHHLNQMVADAGPWSYVILFAIIFCETGLVVTPFLPGDSLLFACGALAAGEDSPLNIGVLFVALAAAAILGDTANYHLGKYVGPKVFHGSGNRWLKREHLDRTHKFYEKYGGKTIILARFVPIVRTFAPFVAGIGAMSYWKFLAYNVIGGLLWMGLLLGAGYLFGNVPVVKKNFSLVVLAIIVISVLPVIWEYIRAKRQTGAQQ